MSDRRFTEKPPLDPGSIWELPADHAAMRENRYAEDLWKKSTGKTVDELGAEWKTQVMAQLAAPAE